MPEYDNTLRGALFINKDKRSPNHPDYKGNIETDDGSQFWVSAWIKEIRSGQNAGDKFLFLALTPKDNNAATTRSVHKQADSGAADFLAANASKIDAHRPASRPAQPPIDDDFDPDSDIPFD